MPDHAMKTDPPGVYVAVDLGLVAFLQLRGLAYTIDRSSFPHQFLFADSVRADDLSQLYWDQSPESAIPAQAFVVALQSVKSQIFRRGKRSGRRLETTDAWRKKT